jgi:hypothetical protein
MCIMHDTVAVSVVANPTTECRGIGKPKTGGVQYEENHVFRFPPRITRRSGGPLGAGGSDGKMFRFANIA